MTDARPRCISGWRLLAYALPALVIALPTIPVYIHLPALYGVQLGLGLATTGLILLLARLFDAVTDPLIGALSDRFGFRGGRRKPWIAIGAVIAGVGLFKVLTPPQGVEAAYLLSWSVLLYAGWTMVAVPYLAWGAALTTDYNERTRITAWREGLALVGIVAAGALTAVTANRGWTDVQSTEAIAWLAIGLGLIVVPLLLWFVPDTGQERVRTAGSLGSRANTTIRNLISNGPFKRLLAGWFLNGIANGIPAALFFIYLEHGLGVGAEERSLFVLAYFVSAIGAIPLWSGLSRRFGKHRVWCWAMIFASTGFLAVPFLPVGAVIPFAGVCIVTGMALGADLVLPPAIQADVLDYDRWRFNHDRAGLQFALWGMSTKLALALAVGLALPALDALGFDPVEVGDDGRWALVVIYAWVPVVIKIVAIAVVWGFPLTSQKLRIIRCRLDQRRARLLEPREVAS